ncbi:hypothetical protein BCR36DRAFT_315816 [Piromyces finnis]|uniref:CBM10 domain-containing protein n=1 Tax=Piromyces finnis TaxID=1754191 RepID=A0A1Y1VPD8_9FUNG|nr:hypothetical protein BCR36DRAFT_315816 [Piromyces finnis]|eukprot:ORX61256.1 hypothetical protein BCR36DRAFT_315816 [Piromyces finnis]
MRSFKFFALTLAAIVGSTFGAKKGSESSFTYMSGTTPFKYSEFKDIVIYGDSYTTVSTNYNTMEYTGENLSKGKNWPQHLIDPIHPMKMWNFAANGAVVDARIVGQYTPMTEQYSYFLKHMGKGQKFNTWKGETTLFTIWFGINDLLSKRGTGTSVDEQIATSMFEMIEGMYNEGGRNFMIFFVPDVSKSPLYYGNETQKTYIPAYNQILNKYAMMYQASHPDTNFFVYNTFSEFEYIMENKSEYGLTNITDVCQTGFGFGGFQWGGQSNCDEKTYFWADNLHPSPKVHEALAYDIDKFLSTNEKNQQLVNGNNNNQDQDSCWSEELGYPCCTSTTKVVYTDESGNWGVENNNWCGIVSETSACWAELLGYSCCSTKTCRNAVYTDDDGQWDVENGNWCGITSANTMC